MKQNQILLTNGKLVDIGNSVPKQMGNDWCRFDAGMWRPIYKKSEVARIYINSKPKGD